MPTATAPAHAGARGSVKGARLARKDAGLLAERAHYWRTEGLTDSELRRELREEGFTVADIRTELAREREDSATEPSGEPKPARPKRAEYAGFRKDAPEPAHRPAADPHPIQLRMPGTPAGLMLAIVAYPAVLAFLTRGPSGLKAWFLAKFLNRTASDAGAAPSAYYAAGSPDVTTTSTAGYGSGSPRGQVAAQWAIRQVGKPYMWGGTGPDGFDCSGLTSQAWKAAGVNIPRTTLGQIATGRRVRKADLAPGDLVFPIKGHVQMYLGGGQIIEAPRTGVPVRIMPLGTVVTARRPA